MNKPIMNKGGSLLERMWRDEIEQSRPRLLARVA